VELCLLRAVEGGPLVGAMCLGEELCHAVNPDLSLAAVAVARGYNATGRHRDAEAICNKVWRFVLSTVRRAYIYRDRCVQSVDGASMEATRAY
jgi:hypothetical protein